MRIDTKTTLRVGDRVQFPSQAVRELGKIIGDDFWFKKGTKINQCYSQEFVYAYCTLVPEKANLVEFINNTRTRNQAIDVSYSVVKEHILEGFVIDDEEILDWNPEAED